MLLRSKVFYFIVIASTIVGLAVDSPNVRWVLAGALVLVAIPLFRAVNGASEFVGATKALRRLQTRLKADEDLGEDDPRH